jgi:hypothetical protein
MEVSLERKKSEGPEPQTTIQCRLAREAEALRRWTDWLQRSESIVMNLRPDTEVETKFVSFDRLRVVRNESPPIWTTSPCCRTICTPTKNSRCSTLIQRE